MLSMPGRRIKEMGLYLAEFAMDFLPGDADVNAYNANDFLALFDQWYPHFIRYAETNRMLEAGEKDVLQENEGDLIGFIKDAAVDAAREIIMEKI
jgi:hypothetical protein